MTGPPRSSRACTRSSQPRRSVAGKPVSNRPRFIQDPPIRNTARGMDRHAHTRPIWAKWAADQCELRETGTATTRRGGDSWACAMNPGMEIVNWANSTQVNRRGSRIQGVFEGKSAIGGWIRSTTAAYPRQVEHRARRQPRRGKYKSLDEVLSQTRSQLPGFWRRLQPDLAPPG